MIAQSLFTDNKISRWIGELQEKRGGFTALLKNAVSGLADGYGQTIIEICQQPVTWSETARRVAACRTAYAESLAGCARILLTGSGSSQYAGECAAPALTSDLGLRVEVVGGGELLLRRIAELGGESTLVVSLARSGESPESVAVMERLLSLAPRLRHLVVTCNAEGRLATQFLKSGTVRVVDLGAAVNDRSLVMTSSFTSLVLGARYLGWADRPAAFAARVDALASAGRELLATWPDRLGEFVAGPVRRVVFLSSERRVGACHESSLKLLEMTCGRVATMSQTFLGLRHGPMSFIDDSTLVVCFLSSDPLTHSYERDVIQELNAKNLGARKLLAGPGIAAADLCRPGDIALPYAVPAATPDDDLALLDVMVAQILGFHRSREEGLKPDSPSPNGVISRVVGHFSIHHEAGNGLA